MASDAELADVAREHARQLRNRVLQQEGASITLDKGVLIGLAVFLDDAAEALDSKLAAEREALAEGLYLAAGNQVKEWAEVPDSAKRAYRRQGDRLLASGVIERKKRLPTREEIVYVLGHTRDYEEAGLLNTGVLADAVLMLLGVKGDG